MSTLDTTDTLRARYARAAPRLDPEGFRLFYAAQEIAGIPYLWEVFPYEDARGQFELGQRPYAPALPHRRPFRGRLLGGRAWDHL